MTKTTELRLGNWVHSLETNSHVKITAIDEEGYIAINTITFDGQDDSMIDPIELTEEVLLKCRFVINDGIFEKEGIRLFQVRNLYFRGNFPIKSDIKTLHQLQNLYFALTNKELEYEV